MQQRQTRAAAIGWRALLLALVVATCWLAFNPAPPRQIDTGWDKANHWLAFASMALCATFAFAGVVRRHLKVALALLALGVLIELVQTQVPNRNADVLDVIADCFGIGGGLLLAWAWQRIGRLRERRALSQG